MKEKFDKIKEIIDNCKQYGFPCDQCSFFPECEDKKCDIGLARKIDEVINGKDM